MMRGRELMSIYRMIGECRDLGADPRAWRTHLLDGLRRMLGAYVGVAGEMRGFLSGRQPALDLFSVGWVDQAAARRWDEFIETGPPESDPTFPPLMTLLSGKAPLATKSRPELVRDRPWYRSRHFNEYRRVCGVDHCLHSYLRLPSGQPHIIHIIELHRVEKDRSFSERDGRILHFLHAEITPLLGKQLALMREPSACDLSPRLRQVLQCLLAGDSEKQVARRLGIAAATVHEYVVAIYRHFGVSSRGELMARWIRSP